MSAPSRLLDRLPPGFVDALALFLTMRFALGLIALYLWWRGGVPGPCHFELARNGWLTIPPLADQGAEFPLVGVWQRWDACWYSKIAAFGYGAFATTMTVGRLLADRVTAKVGSMAVLRWGSAIGAAGIATAALSPWIWLALVGWAVAGIGLSGTVPQLFSAAGHAEPGAAAANMSRVVGIGYLGVLAGPAVIGWMTHVMPLNIAFLLPVAFCAIAALSAGVLRPEPAEERVAA